MPVLAQPERPDVARRVGDPRSPLDPDVASDLLAKLTSQEIERAEPDIDYIGIMTATGLCEGAIFDRCVGSLGVLGYGRPWLAARLRMDERLLAPGAPGRTIDPRLMRRVLAAAIRIGNRWATPESTGQTPEQIRATHERAIKGGYLVPASYGPRYEHEGGMALPREGATPPQVTGPGRWRRTPDQTIAAKIQAVAYFCEHGGSEHGVGERFGLSGRTVGRARRGDLGIEVVMDGRTHTILAPGQGDLVAEVIKAANAVAIGEDPRIVWSRLYSYAEARRRRRAAEHAARRVHEAWTAQGATTHEQHTEREDSAA